MPRRCRPTPAAFITPAAPPSASPPPASAAAAAASSTPPHSANSRSGSGVGNSRRALAIITPR
eukprot:927195-Prymnesium_polylepis.1